MKTSVCLLFAAASALCASRPGYGQNSRDYGGVGALGTIGRGTITGPDEPPSAEGRMMSAYEGVPYYGGAPVYQGVPVAGPVAAPMFAPARPPVVAVGASRSPVAAATAGRRPPASRPGARATEPARARNNPYVWYNRGWLHGYWNIPIGSGESRPSGPAATEPGVAPGRGRGWGLPAWLIGPMVYRWGYLAYENPFVREVRADGGPDYTHPVNAEAAPAGDEVLSEGLRVFGEARAAYRREDYSEALRLADEALRRVPDCPSLHLFRGFTLLSLHRYREAAAVFHAAVAVVPGWDWTTMARLYDRLDTFTRQLRLLESYVQENRQSAPAHFLLAVEYLTTGYSDAALIQLRQAATLRPDDELIRRLVRELGPGGPGPGATAAAARAATGAASGELRGTWIAHPRPDVTIRMKLGREGQVDWEVDDHGAVRQYEGFGLLVDGILTLTEDSYDTMAGPVVWKDATHFTFRILEARPGDPGLSFAKSP